MASKVNNGGGSPWRVAGWGTAAALLLVPLLAGWPWTLSDYVFAAVLFALVGGGLELAARRSGDRHYRAGVAVALATAFLLVWINAAVGIIGSEDNPANLIYFAVIGVGLAGAVVAGFRAAGMAWAMGAAAAVQLGITLVALIGGVGASEPPGPIGILVLNLFFVGMCAISAALFRAAATR